MSGPGFAEMVDKTVAELRRAFEPSPDLMSEKWAESPMRLKVASAIEYGEALSEEQRFWLIDVLKNKKFPAEKRGKPNRPNFELVITHLVNFRIEDGMTATRNDETCSALSACDCVAKALKNFGETHASYEQVKKTWLKNRGKVTHGATQDL